MSTPLSTTFSDVTGQKPGMTVADNSVPGTSDTGRCYTRFKLRGNGSERLLGQQDCTKDCAGKSLACYQVQAEASSNTSFATSVHKNTEIKANAESTIVNTRLVNDETQVAAVSGLESEPAKPDHKMCKLGVHTNACWNNPGWALSNKTRKAYLEDRIHAGKYKLSAEGKKTSHDGKYQFSYQCYSDKDGHYFGYSNNKLIRCSDGKVLMDINRNYPQPFCKYFKCNGDEWVVSGHSYMSPLLVNLTTEKTYEQHADQYCPSELIWMSVEASPDGQTLLVGGLVWGGAPYEYRFYDFSQPDQGFRLLPLASCLMIPDEDHTIPEWSLDKDNNNIVTLVAEIDFDDGDSGSDSDDLSQCSKSSSDSDDHKPLFRFVLRREAARMVEIGRTLVKKKA